MPERNILFIADQSVPGETILADTVELSQRFGVAVEVVQGEMGASKEEIAQYILRTETEGPEWVEPPDALLEKAADAEVIVTHFAAVGSRVIQAAPKLKLIGVLRSGVENVNLQAATARDIPVISSPGRVADPVADYTVGMMIAEARNIARSSLTANGGQWVIRFRNYPYAHNLAGKTVGIVGFGAIGQKVAQRLVPFGVRIVAHDPFLPAAAISALGVEPLPLEALLRQSDYVTLHARLGEDTRHMIGARELAWMKPTAFFVNTARAGLVDEAALVDALQRHAIGGAALDVFETEPMPANHPLLALDNVTLTPHLAGTTSNVGSNSIAVIMENLRRYYQGEPLRHIMNGGAGG